MAALGYVYVLLVLALLAAIVWGLVIASRYSSARSALGQVVWALAGLGFQTAVMDKSLEHTLWPSLYKQADQEFEPPPGAFASAIRALRVGAPANDAATWADEALLQETTSGDTHPAPPSASPR